MNSNLALVLSEIGYLGVKVPIICVSFWSLGSA